MRLTEREREIIRKRIVEMNDELMELGCDSVQVIATAPLCGDNWMRFAAGKGNLYARFGAVYDWKETMDGMTLANEINNQE